MADLDYVGVSVSPRLVRVSGTTLFHVAADRLGDATQWYRIAELNGLADPWIDQITELSVPLNVVSSNGGIWGR